MTPVPLADADLDRLQALLDAVPAPLEPLDATALDGFLCGVLLQPQPVGADRWLKFVTDVDGRPAPPGPAMQELLGLVMRRHAELEQAIARREWFDPWIYQIDPADAQAVAKVDADADSGNSGNDNDNDRDRDGDDDSPSASVLPWVAGFAAAMDAFPALMAIDNPELVEPLALLYLHFDPDDLEDADALLAVIETLEPPTDLAEAVQDLVRALMLIADVTRPRPAATVPRRRHASGARRPAGAAKRPRRRSAKAPARSST